MREQGEALKLRKRPWQMWRRRQRLDWTSSAQGSWDLTVPAEKAALSGLVVFKNRCAAKWRSRSFVKGSTLSATLLAVTAQTISPDETLSRRKANARFVQRRRNCPCQAPSKARTQSECSDDAATAKAKDPRQQRQKQSVWCPAGTNEALKGKGKDCQFVPHSRLKPQNCVNIIHSKLASTYIRMFNNV